MTAHKFWRFRITENNGGDTVVFSALTLSVAPFTTDLTPVNQAKVATYTHQGISGDVYVGIWTGVMPSENTQLYFEFKEPQLVGAYSLQAVGSTAPKSWVLEHSDDGVDWIIAAIQYAQRNWQTNENRHFVCELYELSLSVNGSNAAPHFNAFIHDLNGDKILKKKVFNGVTTFLMPDSKPVSVTVLQDFGTAWQAGKYYKAGTLISPTNPQTTPFYYRNRTGAISDLIEPTWSTNPEIFTHDSGCIWELVERLNQPITQSPLIPTRKIS
jgi:hypothetical protein